MMVKHHLRTPLGLMITVLYVFYPIKQACTETTGIIRYQEVIAHPTAKAFIETFNIPPSKKVEIKYNIAFKADKCCPVIEFDLRHSAWRGRAYYDECSEERLYNTALYSRWSIYTQKNFPHSGCRLVSDNYVCLGTRTLVVTSPRIWAFGAWYECAKATNLNVTIGFELKYFTDFHSQCEPLRKEYCKTHFNYSYTTFPSPLGHTSQREANDMYLFGLAVAKIYNCYQHAHLFACRTLFPECLPDGRAIYPCSEMCSEFASGCVEGLITFNQPAVCGGLVRLKDPYQCFYEPVRCPHLEPPEFGTIVTSGQMLLNVVVYSCLEGYVLVGDKMRHCVYSGVWNGTEPLCKPENSTATMEEEGKVEEQTGPRTWSIVIPAAVSSFLGLLLAITVVASICYKERIKLFCLYNLRDQRTLLEQKKKLFISYSSEDMDEINQNFLPELRNQLPSWDAHDFQLDFPGGQSLFKCIDDAVSKCPAMLVLLNENYIASEYCTYEFRGAETRTVTDRDFCLVVIVFVRNGNEDRSIEIMNALPESLRTFLRNRVYLTFGEPLFWHKLRRSLENKANTP